ncbi:Lrp/AsnC family transcriptional regulator [Janibacter melonis]|uniref:Lrp/AsnC family transcriptional regulator n=1 Tax=Janibacter melonis TaxID=262209 RepID=UPI00174A5249|nr:Lrp/AsnC family transcriptional regulator [Janibacter melonis]
MLDVDATDALILLERDQRHDATLIEIAQRLGISRNTVHARWKRLHEAGALRPTSSSLLPASIGRPLTAFVTLSVSQQEIASVYAKLGAIPEVVEAHTTTGDADLMVRVVARDTEDLHRVTQRIQLAPGVQRSSTMIATTEVIPQRMEPLIRALAHAES